MGKRKAELPAPSEPPKKKLLPRMTIAAKKPTGKRGMKAPKSQPLVGDTDSEEDIFQTPDSSSDELPSDTVQAATGIQRMSGIKTRSSGKTAAHKTPVKGSSGRDHAAGVTDADAEGEAEDDNGEDEEDDGEDELPPVDSPVQTRRRTRSSNTAPARTRSGLPTTSNRPSPPRLFAAGVSVPPLPQPRATEISLPNVKQPQIERAKGFRKMKNQGVKEVNLARSQAELRHNAGSIGPMIIRDEIRDLFILPNTHTLQRDIKCTNCIIKFEECVPPPNYMGTCQTCKESKSKLCSFQVDAQAELTALGHLQSVSAPSVYHISRSFQSLLADQAAIQLSFASLQAQITRAALNIEAFGHEWLIAGRDHGVAKLSKMGLSRTPEEMQDFLDFLTAQGIGSSDVVFSQRLADQQAVIAQYYQFFRTRDGDYWQEIREQRAQNRPRSTDPTSTSHPSSSMAAPTGIPVGGPSSTSSGRALPHPSISTSPIVSQQVPSTSASGVTIDPQISPLASHCGPKAPGPPSTGTRGLSRQTGKQREV